MEGESLSKYCWTHLRSRSTYKNDEFLVKHPKIPIEIKFNPFPLLWRENLTNESTNAPNSPK